MSVMVIFRGHVSGERANAQHVLRINAVNIIIHNYTRFICLLTYYTSLLVVAVNSRTKPTNLESGSVITAKAATIHICYHYLLVLLRLKSDTCFTIPHRESLVFILCVAFFKLYCT